MAEHLVKLRDLHVRYFNNDMEYQNFLKTIDRKDIVHEETF
jgi:hypothetical protein